MKTYLRHRISNVVDVKELIVFEYLDFEGKYKDYSESHDFWELCYVEKGERMTCVRLDHPLGDRKLMLGEAVQYTVWVKSNVPVCACFGRLDVRQTNMAYYSVEGYSF